MTRFIKKALPGDLPVNNPVDPPLSPSNAPAGASPSPTPNQGTPGLTEPPTPPTGNSPAGVEPPKDGLMNQPGNTSNPMMPRVPEIGNAAPPPNRPTTDINIDAATGNVTVKKGPVQLTLAKFKKRSDFPVGIDKVREDNRQKEEELRRRLKIKNKDVSPHDSRGMDYGGDDRSELGMAPSNVYHSPHSVPSKIHNIAPGDTVSIKDPLGNYDSIGSVAEVNYNDNTAWVNNTEQIEGDWYGEWLPLDSLSVVNKNNDWQKDEAQMERLRDFDRDRLYRDSSINIFGELYDDIPDEILKRADATDETGSPWDQFNKAQKSRSWEEGSEYSDDTWDTYGNNPKNRRVPQLSKVKIKVPEWMNVLGVAYMIEVQLAAKVSVDGNTITVDNVEDAMGLIVEMNEFGCEAELVSGSLPDLYKGMKVAFKGDLPQFNHMYDSSLPPITATLLGEKDGRYLLRNDIWGAFETRKEFVDEV